MAFDRDKAINYADTHWNIPCDDGVFWLTDGAVVTAGGLPVPCSAGASSSWSRATLMVRPEAIRFAAHKDERLCLEGEVLQSSFLGSFSRVAIACAATPAPVLATLPYGKRHRQELRVDATVSFTWDPEDAVVLDAKQA